MKNKKQFAIPLAAAVCFVTGLAGVAYANQPVELFVNGSLIVSDQPSYVEENSKTTYVPIRHVSEALGGVVSWDPSSQLITIERKGKIIKLQINNENVMVDGKTSPLGKPVKLARETGRSMIPIHFFADYLNCQIKYSASAGVGILDEKHSDAHEVIEQLKAKSSEIKGLSYQYTLTATEVVTGKVWLQGTKSRVETLSDDREAIQMVEYFDGQNRYSYNTKENIAVKIPVSQTMPTPFDYLTKLKADTVKSFEAVQHNERSCILFTVQGDVKEEIKFWIDQTLGIPIRIETSLQNGNKIVMEYTNIATGDQPDRLFKLPSNVKLLSSTYVVTIIE